jgi:hypothetical protein
MMRTEAGAVARCERVQARKALIENEIMQCEGELRILMSQFGQDPQVSVNALDVLKSIIAYIKSTVNLLKLEHTGTGQTMGLDFPNEGRAQYRRTELIIKQQELELTKKEIQHLQKLDAYIQYNNFVEISRDSADQLDVCFSRINELNREIALLTTPEASIPLILMNFPDFSSNPLSLEELSKAKAVMIDLHGYISKLIATNPSLFNALNPVADVLNDYKYTIDTTMDPWLHLFWKFGKALKHTKDVTLASDHKISLEQVRTFGNIIMVMVPKSIKQARHDANAYDWEKNAKARQATLDAVIRDVQS